MRSCSDWKSRSEEHTSELQSRLHLVCRLLLEKKKTTTDTLEAGFLSRLLLNTDEGDIARLNEIRRWFKPDLAYACDLALVPMLARLEDRGIPLVSAAQGFELVYRRGVRLLEAIAQRLFFLMLRLPPRSTLFPYTTLFR